MKRRFLLQGASAAALLPHMAFAEDKYPSHAISWICPYAAGGNSDQRSRQVAAFMSTALGQPVVVDNKPGAGGNIGTEMIARAKPDGYTLGMGNFAPLAINPAMFKHMSFDPAKDLTMIALIERGPLVLCVRPESPFKSVKDVVAAARAKPGQLSFASGGLGGSHHLSGEMLKYITGIHIVHIPYKGGAPATTDLLGGQVDMMFEEMYAAAPLIRAGKLRPLGITSRKRSPLFPEIPTMIEGGVPNFEVLNWQGLVGPAGMPRPLVTMLNKVVNNALTDPQIRKQMLSQGNEIADGSPELFTAFVSAERARWSKVVIAQNIKPE